MPFCIQVWHLSNSTLSHYKAVRLWAVLFFRFVWLLFFLWRAFLPMEALFHPPPCHHVFLWSHAVWISALTVSKGVIYLFMSISLIHLTSVFPYMERTGQVILHGLKELLDNIGMWPGDRAAYFIWTLGWYLAITTISYTEWQQTVSGGHLGLNGSTGVLTVLSQPEEENSFLVQAGVTCKAQGWSRYTKLTARLRKSDIKHCVASVENEQQAWLIQTWLSCYTNRQEALYILQPSWRYLTT